MYWETPLEIVIQAFFDNLKKTPHNSRFKNMFQQTFKKMYYKYVI